MKIKHKFQTKSKYNNKPTIIDDIRFASIKEAKRYQYWKAKQESGEILFFLMQVPFHLPGGVIYRLDYMPFFPNGDIITEDVKGVRTAMYILKKKQVEALYNITITEI